MERSDQAVRLERKQNALGMDFSSGPIPVSPPNHLIAGTFPPLRLVLPQYSAESIADSVRKGSEEHDRLFKFDPET